MRLRILGQYIHGSLAVLGAVELAMLSGTMLVATLVRFRTGVEAIELTEGPLWPRMLLFSFVMIVCLFAFGLYSSRQRAPAFGIAVRLLAATAAGTAVTALCFYVLPDVWIGRGVMSIAAIVAFLALIASRYVFTHVVDDAAFKRRVLVYGCGQRAGSIANLRRRTDRRGFTVVGYAQPDGEECSVPAGQLIDAHGKLEQICEQHNVDEVVVAMDDRRRAFPLLELLECRLAGTDVTELLTFLERETGRVRIDVLNPSWMIFGEGFRRDPLRLFSSRMLDLVASLLILLVSLPVMTLTAVAIKLEDGWRAPVLYRQARVGLGGRDASAQAADPRKRRRTQATAPGDLCRPGRHRQ